MVVTMKPDTEPMASEAVRIYLVRHGEVLNPNHVVYGDLPGFHLSPTGVLQAHRAADFLSQLPIDVVMTSPLSRAFETASAIARHHRTVPVLDARLTESNQFRNWTGNRWEVIPRLFQEEYEGYLADASSVDKGRTLEHKSAQIISAIEDRIGLGDHHIVVVSHQDPIAATRLTMIRRDLSELRAHPPSHGEVITLTHESENRWRELSRWSPPPATDRISPNPLYWDTP